MSSTILSGIRRIPPVTRFLTGSLLGVSMLYMLEIIWQDALIYRFHEVLHSYQIWRLYTSFFVGSEGLFFLYEFLMLYYTANKLESGYDSADLAWQLFFACIAIMMRINSISPLPAKHHLQVPSHLLATTIFLYPLMNCIFYLLSARTSARERLSIYGFTTLPAKYAPHAMLLFELLIGGREALFRALVGVAVGYAWWRIVWGSEKGAAWARAPTWAKNLGSRVMNASNGHTWGSGQTLAKT